MKVAIFAPVIERVPPPRYGGTEMVIYLLVEGLIKKGFDVTLFASADSLTSAKLIPVSSEAIRTNPENIWPYDYFMSQDLAADIVKNYLLKNHFDIFHNHNEYFGLMASKDINIPKLTTLHGILNFKTIKKFFSRFDNSHFISISNDQRKYQPKLNWLSTVYNGINLNEFTYNPNPKGNYLLYFSRIAQQKGCLEAIQVAKKVGMKLIMASKIDYEDKDFFELKIEPEIDNKQIIYLGEVDNDKKLELFQNAYAYLFPIKWDEPFGLTMVEAMACGAPVLAFRAGSVPEIIADGTSGYISENIDQMVADVKKVDELKRENCRKQAEKFSSEHMVENYIKVYKKILAKT